MTDFPRELLDGRRWNGLAYLHDSPTAGCELCDACKAVAESYRAQLAHDQLTAEFRSPLHRDNRRRKLRAQKVGATLWQDPEQVKLF